MNNKNYNEKKCKKSIHISPCHIQMTFKMFMTLTCHRKQTNEHYAKKEKLIVINLNLFLNSILTGNLLFLETMKYK